MKPSHLILPLLGAGLLAGTLLHDRHIQAQPSASSTLPGATPAVEAIRFPTHPGGPRRPPARRGRRPTSRWHVRDQQATSRLPRRRPARGCRDGDASEKRQHRQGSPPSASSPRTLRPIPRPMIWRVKLADIRVTGNPKSGHGIEAVNVNEFFLDGVTVSENGGDGIRMVNCYEDPGSATRSSPTTRRPGLTSRMPRHRGLGQPVRGEPRRAPVCRRLQPVHDGQLPRRPPARRRRDREHVRLRGRRQHDRGVRGDRHRPGPRLLRDHAERECDRPRDVGGIDLRDAHGCTVSANTFTIVKKNALLIGPSSSRITVTGNNFSDSSIGDGAVKREADDLDASGITLNGTSDIAVSGNLFSGVTPKALVASRATRAAACCSRTTC